MAHRITNTMMVNTFNRNLHMNMTRMERYQNQLATSRKIARLSDDSIGVIKSIGARSKLYDIEQYRRNVEDARAWMTASEVALTELNTIIKRGYELAVQAANDTLGPEERVAISHEIKQLRDHVVMLGNTTMGDKFVFGGYNVTHAPFTAELIDEDTNQYSLWANGSGEVVDLIEQGLLASDLGDLDDTMHFKVSMYMNENFASDDFRQIGMPIGIGPVTFMGAGDENIFKIFNDFANMLNRYGDDEPGSGNLVEHDEVNLPELQPFIRYFQEAQERVLAVLAELGGRMNRLDLIEDRYSQDVINYTQMISDVEDLDQSEAIMNFSMQEAVYRAALSVGARVIQPTLMDFLR